MAKQRLLERDAEQDRRALLRKEPKQADAGRLRIKFVHPLVLRAVRKTFSKHPLDITSSLGGDALCGPGNIEFQVTGVVLRCRRQKPFH